MCFTRLWSRESGLFGVRFCWLPLIRRVFGDRKRLDFQDDSAWPGWRTKFIGLHGVMGDLTSSSRDLAAQPLQ